MGAPFLLGWNVCDGALPLFMHKVLRHGAVGGLP